MKLISPAFAHNGIIPSKYTCDGENMSPPLEFTDVPPEAKSLVLLVDDPDVPKHLRPDGMWDHWVVFNIPPDTSSVAEGVTPPGVVGMNSSRKNAFAGPCPPDRAHRYFFKLYALDTLLHLTNEASKGQVFEAMAGHVVATAELMGRYERVPA